MNGFPGAIPNDFSFAMDTPIGSALNVAPGGTLTTSVIPLSFQNLAFVENKQMSILIWGRFTYQEIFGADHFTNFAFVVDVTGDLTTRDTQSIAYRAYEKHNESD